MKCIECKQDIKIEEALLNSPFSWPEMETIWHKCSKCGAGNHIRFTDGGYGQIKILGAPGPDWEQVSSFSESSISLRKDPGYLHVWLKGKHHEIKARE
ncbi:MAG: hypothetical protein R3E57_00570 [Porticoccaceae bacterium]